MIAGVSPNSFYNPGMLNRMQQIQQEFQQLGKDLQTGNLAAAQTDFAALQQMDPQAAPTASTAGNPIAQAFGQLAQDLQAGNLSGAQQDFVNLQQDFQGLAGTGHRHHAGGASSHNPLVRGFNELLQMLSGNQPGAQQAYTSLQQGLGQFAKNGSLTATPPVSAGPGNLSVIA